MGPELMDLIRKQAERFGTEIVTDDATELDLAGPVKRVIISGEEHLAKPVVLAMGSAYRELGAPGEKRLSGHGVSWCATCDGFFFRGKDIAVVGGGDSAVEEATFLTRFADSVTLVHRRDALRASKIMADRATRTRRSTSRWNSDVDEILGEESVSGLRLRDIETGDALDPGRRRGVRRHRARPAQRADPRPDRPGRGGLRPRRLPAHPYVDYPVCSPAGISSTTPIVKPSPRPPADARRPSTSSTSSTPSRRAERQLPAGTRHATIRLHHQTPRTTGYEEKQWAPPPRLSRTQPSTPTS